MATRMVFSVGDSTADLKTSGTIGVSGTTATFSAAQTNNIGVGDEIIYNTTDKAYIVGKTSTTVWTVRSATGGTPASAVGGTTLNSIKHVFASLEACLTTDAWSGVSYLNTTNLVSADIQLDIACYRDSADDTGRVDGDTGTITTDATRYLRIYTPFDTATECNNSQRHNGIWGSTGYKISKTSGWAVIYYRALYIRFEGLQIECNAPAQNDGTILAPCRNGTHVVYVESNLINLSNISTVRTGWVGLGFNQGNGTVFCSNNVLFTDDHDSGHTWRGVSLGNGGSTVYFYNNTISGFGVGIYRVDGFTVVMKNNLITNCTTCISGTVTQTYSATSDTTADGTGSRDSQTFSFVDSANGDFHLTGSDAGARTYGLNLSGDANYPITIDIDRTTRTGSWDIGADQYINIDGSMLFTNTTLRILES